MNLEKTAGQFIDSADGRAVATPPCSSAHELWPTDNCPSLNINQPSQERIMKNPQRNARTIVFSLSALGLLIVALVSSNYISPRAKAQNSEVGAAVLISPTAGPACVAPPSGMAGWWPGENNANDIQGANNGTLQGGVSFASGEVGQAFSFNGSDADVKVPASSSLNAGVGSGLTLDLWINPTSASTTEPLIEWNSPIAAY